MIQPKYTRKLPVKNRNPIFPDTYLVKTLEFFSRVDSFLAFCAALRHVSTRLYQALADRKQRDRILVQYDAELSVILVTTQQLI